MGCLKQPHKISPHVIRGLIHSGKVCRAYAPIRRGAGGAMHASVSGNAVDLARVLPNNHRGPIHHDHAIRHLMQCHSTIKGGSHVGCLWWGAGFFRPVCDPTMDPKAPHGKHKASTPDLKGKQGSLWHPRSSLAPQ